MEDNISRIELDAMGVSEISIIKLTESNFTTTTIQFDYLNLPVELRNKAVRLANEILEYLNG